ncbi:hypothetical protein ACHAW5_011081 [Stephanodiscus triporus]|uniref:uroporphyrinogen-III C-methyltransferase n=1 Tax=Stephanodiscus triporus TaxID=2934178 RepID=A0ABD3QZD9_9STRA
MQHPSTRSRRPIAVHPSPSSIVLLVLAMMMMTTTTTTTTLLLLPVIVAPFDSVVAFVPTHPAKGGRTASSSVSSSSLLRAAYIDEGHPRDRHRVPTTIVPDRGDADADAPSSSSSSSPPSSSSSSSSSVVRRAIGSRPPPVHPTSGGRITLVGAGPGSPDLLTIAAHRIISDPDAFVVVDRLVSDEILNLVRGETRIANKHPGCADIAQDEIYRWCREGVIAGRHVVRLKIGDPFVFGRGGEEVLEFRKFGVEPRIVPGVSAAFSAPLLGSIPVTHRGVSNQVVMCTGYGREGTSPDLIRYHEEQTVVFLMAVGRLRSLCVNLVEKAGYPEYTPVAIVERAGCPDQRTVVGTVGTIADIAEENDVRPPSTIVVGEVVNVLLTEGDFAITTTEEEADAAGAGGGGGRRRGLLVRSMVD